MLPLSSQIPFSIGYKNNRFLIAHSQLSPDHQRYLQEYLNQVNDYQIIGSYEGSPVFSLYQPPLGIEAGMRSLYFRLKRRFEGIRVPASATIAVNKSCQCDCEHCSAVFYNTSHKIPLSLEVLTQALHESIQVGVTNLILLGGEPLLLKKLPQLIASVPKNLSVVTLFTNGEYLSREKCIQLKNAGLMGAFISLDDTEAKNHDALRNRPGLFKKALEGIENLKEAGLLVAISSYLTPDKIKIGGFEKMMELGKSLGVNEITFFDAIPSGRWLRDSSCLLNLEDRKLIKDKVTHYRSLKNYPGLAVQSNMTSECGSAFCFAANTQFYLSAVGEMCPCDFTPLTIGTYPEKSIETLWNEMTSASPYNRRASSCRMQDPQFRKDYISPIPLKGPYPYPLNLLKVRNL